MSGLFCFSSVFVMCFPFTARFEPSTLSRRQPSTLLVSILATCLQLYMLNFQAVPQIALGHGFFSSLVNKPFIICNMNVHHGKSHGQGARITWCNCCCNVLSRFARSQAFVACAAAYASTRHDDLVGDQQSETNSRYRIAWLFDNCYSFFV